MEYVRTGTLLADLQAFIFEPKLIRAMYHAPKANVLKDIGPGWFCIRGSVW